MDNITLSIKDADWVANIIREQIEDLDSAYKNALEEGNNRANIAKELVKKVFPSDDEMNKQLEELNKAQREGLKNLELHYQDKLYKYSRIVELMMTGSS